MMAPRALLLDLVEWVAVQPRAYDEVMASWRTSCPRLPVWEDALDAGLVCRAREDGRAIVKVTAQGILLLATEGR